MQKLKQLLDYAATHPYSIITYHASDISLAGHIDASYLSETKSRSRAGENFFMSTNTEPPPNNVEVMTISKIIKAVMSSAVEDELGTLFITANKTSHHAKP